jgi:nicotinamidase-related amidase
MDHTPHRLWRLRKLNHAVDAEIRPEVSGGFQVQFLYDAVATYQRTWPTREEAVAEAAGKRAELERSGWMAHW